MSGKKKGLKGKGLPERREPTRAPLSLSDFIEEGVSPRGGLDTSEVRVVAVDAIAPRAGIETRALAADHVLALAQSIAALGLLEPIVVDLRTRLLAGGHRLAALRVLASGDRPGRLRELVGGALSPAQVETARALEVEHGVDLARIPVRVMRFDSETEPERALGVEAGENEQRKDYSRADVKRLLARLEAAGYRTEPGRPRKGERPAMPVLQAVIGKSRATVFAMLAEARREDAGEKVQPPTVSTLAMRCRSVQRPLEKLLEDHRSDMPRERARDARRLLDWIEEQTR